ncbi:tyrosine-type recombinase/integrase [Magnetospirillum sp. SS-4]|uniref:tyrosine-type recombinase/integrase n=1 Tax=Magnetospirillum sp. SS-4 TaxID=2681465 RepID=UPI0013818D4E|nr:tyrosine-type recombinase/integrase [Magnetospirillum sp. SS-4]CAA7627288.1 Integrase family protein [Magnetospirillum sp. SS-4]
MGHSEYDPGAKAWNAGRKIGAKRALKPQQVWAIRFWLDQNRRLRDRATFDLAIDSKLRGCDIVKIKIGELVSGGRVRSRAIVIQQKTGRPVQFELLETARNSIFAWLECRGGTLDDFVFPSRIDHADHISTRQYARLVDEWVTGIGLRREDYGTHSQRQTKASIIYKQTGNLRAVQILLGHTKIESTVRYLGVDIEDALHLAESTEI